MKFGRPLATIVHYTVQFNLECCKSSVSDMDPNNIMNLKKSNSVLKVKFKQIQTYHPYKFGIPLAIIVHYTVQFNLEYCKSYVPDMGPNTI